jgi:hypothetical protein
MAHAIGANLFRHFLAGLPVEALAQRFVIETPTTEFAFPPTIFAPGYGPFAADPSRHQRTLANAILAQASDRSMDAAPSISSPFDVPPEIALRDEAPAANLTPVELASSHQRVEVRLSAAQVRACFSKGKQRLKHTPEEIDFSVRLSTAHH